MKRLLFIIAIVAALVGAKTAWSAIFDIHDFGIVSVVGGFHRDAGACYALLDGTPTFCAANARDWYVDVHGLRSGPATGVLVAGGNGTPSTLQARITCMTIAGNRAVVGGYLTADTDAPELVGDALLFYAIDNGGPGGNTTPDKATANEIYGPGDALPAGFPRNCGEPISTFSGYTDVGDGDVSIHGGL